MKIPGLKILDIYIIKKFLGTYFLSMALIIAIAVVFDLSEKLDDFMEKGAPAKAIFYDYYLNFIPYFVNLFSYLFTFIAVILFTSNMASHTEIIAILSNGISYWRMLIPYVISATIIAAISFSLTNWVIPSANAKRFAFEEQYYRSTPYRFTDRNVHKQIEPGVFVFMENYSNSSDIAYKFSIEKFENGELESKLLSDYAKWDSTEKKWQINNYVIRNFTDSGEVLLKGRKTDTTLSLDPSYFKHRDNVVEAMELKELNEYIDELKLQGAESVNLVEIEKAKRFATPFSTYILAILGVSVSSRKVRGGMGGHLGIGVAISFGYIFFQQFAAQFAIGGFMSPNLAVWIPNIIFAIVAYFFYRYTPK